MSPVENEAEARPSKSKAEARRFKSKAEACFLESDLQSALSYAERAHSLCPSLDGIRAMLTALKILSEVKNEGEDSPSIDYYKAFLIEPFSSVITVKKQYKKLALDLHPDKSDFPGCEDAFKLIGQAYKVLSNEASKEQYDLKLRVMLQENAALNHLDTGEDTFRSSCESCSSVHQFERKYLGHSLVCPNCKSIFIATENAGEVRVYRSERLRKKAVSRTKTVSNQSIGSDNDESITLAEFKARIKRKEKNEDTTKTMLIYKRRTKPRTQNLIVHNFNEERNETCLKRGQIWALYDSYNDRMPRLYALIDEVSTNPFQTKVSWLNNEKNNCGRFKIGSQMMMGSMDEFSHPVKWEKAAKEEYRIYPWKGSVWAFFKGSSDALDYDFVVFLTSYSEPYGASLAYLERVSGDSTVFKRQGGKEAIRVVGEEDLVMVSHHVLARKLPEIDCWELDPSSLPQFK